MWENDRLLTSSCTRMQSSRGLLMILRGSREQVSRAGGQWVTRWERLRLPQPTLQASRGWEGRGKQATATLIQKVKPARAGVRATCPQHALRVWRRGPQTQEINWELFWQIAPGKLMVGVPRTTFCLVTRKAGLLKSYPSSPPEHNYFDKRTSRTILIKLGNVVVTRVHVAG